MPSLMSLCTHTTTAGRKTSTGQTASTTRAARYARRRCRVRTHARTWRQPRAPAALVVCQHSVAAAVAAPAPPARASSPSPSAPQGSLPLLSLPWLWLACCRGLQLQNGAASGERGAAGAVSEVCATAGGALRWGVRTHLATAVPSCSCATVLTTSSCDAVFFCHRPVEPWKARLWNPVLGRSKAGRAQQLAAPPPCSAPQ